MWATVNMFELYKLFKSTMKSNIRVKEEELIVSLLWSFSKDFPLLKLLCGVRYVGLHVAMQVVAKAGLWKCTLQCWWSWECTYLLEELLWVRDSNSQSHGTIIPIM